MGPLVENAITFLPVGGTAHVYLTVTGDWTVSSGLDCNSNSAEVSYLERAKLPENLAYLSGTIFLWDSSLPDVVGGTPSVVLANQWLTDCTIARLGRDSEADLVDKALVYGLLFSDHRHAFRKPRGGRLTQGLGNPDPIGNETLRTTGELINACLAAMGVSATVPSSVNAVDAPRQLEWYNAHAPEKLGELLQNCGHVYAPYSGGGGSVERIGLGTMPAIAADRLASDVTASAVTRLPLTAVFTSGNNAIARTFDQDAGGVAPAWEFVAQDPDDDYQYKALSTIAALGAHPDKELAKGLPDVEDKDRKLFNEQLYKIIRLKSDRFDRVQCPVLRDVLYPDGRVDQPHLIATVAVQGQDGAWINRQTRLNAQTIDGVGNLLSFDQRLGTVSGGTERADFDAFFTPLASADLKPTFTVEDWDKDAGTKLYSAYGFTVGGFGVAAMSEGTARSQMTGFRPATAIYDMPELRAVYLNDGTDNRDTLQASAHAMAQGLLVGSLSARTIEVEGFFPCEIDGRINEVRYSQRDARTTIIRDGLATAAKGRHAHHDGGRAALAPSGPGGVDDDPTRQAFRSPATAQARSQSQQIQRGGAVARTPAAASSKTTPHVTGTRRVPVYVTTPVDGRLNWWHGQSYSGAFNRDASGDFASTDVGQAAPSIDCIVCSSAPLPLHQVIFGNAGPVTDDGKLMIYVDPPHIFVVKVTKDGGSNGSKTAAASWTYTVKDAGDRTLATALAPQRARPAGKMVAAPNGTYGLATYVNSSVVLLDVFGEQAGTGGCNT